MCDVNTQLEKYIEYVTLQEERGLFDSGVSLKTQAQIDMGAGEIGVYDAWDIDEGMSKQQSISNQEKFDTFSYLKKNKSNSQQYMITILMHRFSGKTGIRKVFLDLLGDDVFDVSGGVELNTIFDGIPVSDFKDSVLTLATNVKFLYKYNIDLLLVCAIYLVVTDTYDRDPSDKLYNLLSLDESRRTLVEKYINVLQVFNQ